MKILLTALALTLVLVATPLFAAPVRDAAPAPAATTPAESLSVDYVLGLMRAGMKPGLVVDLIREQDLHFRLAPGDVDRLRSAGASEELVGEVTGRAVVLQNNATAPGEAESESGPTASTSPPSRPRRIGQESSDQGTTAEGESGGSGDGSYVEQDQGPYIAYGYDYWWPYYAAPLWYSWYGFYPYYYAPYAYGYGYPYRSYRYGGVPYRGPRGGGHHGIGTRPWGGHRGGFGGGVRMAPRGSRGGGSFGH
ncbi:MAG TPA: hypothetical protein VNL37_07075, partial [Candidatus Polarisedimenticolia bacterium]|nr:hypothetical protein [Candidatus Polarisedimenticolia bacterium]